MNEALAFFVGVEESVSLIQKLYRPVVVGVPARAPVAGSSVRPEGSAPEPDQTYGVVPPAPVSVDEYDTPLTPSGKAVVVTFSALEADAIVSFKFRNAVLLGFDESVTCTVNVAALASAGVPVIAPVAGSSASPKGKEPA